MKRRDFVRYSTRALAALPLLKVDGILANHQTSQKPYKQLGVQLYSIRDRLEKDYLLPFKIIALLGYKDVEFAGYFDHKPKDLKRYMDELGLESNSTHVRLPQLRNDFERVMETAHIMGQKYIVFPWMEPKERETLDDYKRHAELLNIRGETAKKAGFQMAYHNHDFEFMPIDGKLPYDLLLDETDSDLVKMQLDLYWVVKANKDPIDFFKKAPGRFHLCHIKDKAADGSITTVGKGSIDFNAIFEHAELAGLKHFIVEHDNTNTPYESLGYSYNQLFNKSLI